MYFTRQDYEKILKYIVDHSKKDTDFEDAYNLSGQETLSLVQNGENKNIQISELVRLLSDVGVEVKILQEEGTSLSMVMSQKAITEALNSIRNSLEDNISDVLDVINLDAEKGTVQHQIDTINSHIQGESSESIQSQINAINTHIGAPADQSIQSQINTLSGKIGPISGTVAGNITSINSSVQTLSNTVDSFDTSIENISNRVTTLGNNVSSLSNNVEIVEEDINNLERSINTINTNIGSLDTKINTTNATINRLDGNIGDLQDRKLEKGLDVNGGDLVDNLLSTRNNKALTANQGRILQGNINNIRDVVDTFVHSSIANRGMAVSVSGTRLNLEFTASDLDTVYVQKVGDVLSLTNATR